MTLPIRPLMLTLVALGLTACQGGPKCTAGVDVEKTPVCLVCYEAVSKAHDADPAALEPLSENLRTYDCPCCKEEMSVYIEEGTHMVKCGGCATEGVAWDACRPVDMAAE